MKKIFNSVISVAAILAFVLSCAREEATPVDNGSGTLVTISATIADLATKVTFDPTYDGTYGKPESMDLSWADGDKLRIYDHDDRTQYSDFDLDPASIGQKTGTFTGSLVAASSWDVEIFNGSFDYAAQTQPSDGVTTGLKYLASASDVDEVDDLYFTDFSSVLAITAQMPSSAIAAKIKSVYVTASADIFNGGNTLGVTFNSVGDADDDGVLHFFATLPQGDQAIPAGTTLLVKFNAPGATHDVYTRFITLGARTLTHNKLNTININAKNSASYANSSTTNIGEEKNPYLIGDKYQLNAMRDLLVTDTRVYFKMVDDVDLDETIWAPVNFSEDYQIDFDGDNHTISHLSIDNSAGTYDFSGFIGLLYGSIRNIVFDGADVTGGAKISGIVIGRSGASSHAADLSHVTVKNSTLTSSNNYVGGLAGYIKKSNSISNCCVKNSSITSTIGNVNPSLVGGLVGEMTPNGGCTISDCSAEDVTISGGCTNTNRSGVGGLIGRISSDNVVITRCHTTGTLAPANSNNVGGLVGYISAGTGINITNSYSTCGITRGYTYVGGLVGQVNADAGLTIDHCFASGTLTLKGGYGGKGGLVGTIKGTNVTLKRSVAWNSSISGGHDTVDESSGAVVGYTHPNCILTDNYRKPGMTFNGLFWSPSASFDHANVNGTTTPLKVNPASDESSLVDGTASDFTTANKNSYSYHGKHLDGGITVSPDSKLGFTSSSAISGIDVTPGSDPENPSYTGSNVWGLGTTVDIVDGVQWTNYHGTWQGKIREINIITTTLNEHNKLKLYYNYTDAGKLYLNEKCEYVKNAVAATNGCMTSQFARINDVIKSPAGALSEWTNNCALTIDGDDVNILKVASNYEAAMLESNTVICAGPLLVWKGNKLTASDEWKAADSDDWLGDGGNAGGQPRTAIGINKEGTKVIQVTVDGRWTSGSDDTQKAYGMPTDVLAELMLELGCYKAMNLDGGGGSQMWIYGKGDIHNIVNHPHNTWQTYESGSGYYWSKNGEVARRAACCAVYIQSDLK